MSLQINVIEINKDSSKDQWRCLIEDLKAAKFVSIDLELSGLGQKGGLKSK